MRRLWVSLAGLVVMAVVTGTSVARAQAPTPAAPEYDAKFIVGDTAVEYVGTTTFATDAKGEVTGALTITAPIPGTGVLSGPVKDGTWTARIEFTLPTQSCTGTVSGTATVPTDRKVISGTVTVSSSCGAQAQAATLTFTKK
jgi:hypothetical protein